VNIICQECNLTCIILRDDIYYIIIEVIDCLTAEPE
jgi:hypothetical protein